jgi:hypothetical protein
VFTAIENNPIIVNLVAQANYTGWAINNDGTASHVSCQSGNITLLNYTVIPDHIYQITFTILSISSGYISAFVGGVEGIRHTVSDIIIETIIAGDSESIKLFSNGACQVQLFNVVDITTDTDPTTIVFASKNRKWSDTRTQYPSIGISIFERSIIVISGNVYVQQVGSGSRNNFQGVAFQSSIKFVDAKNPAQVHDYESLNYQANMLLVTTINGVLTSLGQITTLLDTDFIKQKLVSNGQTVTLYQKDNVYSASFLGDANEDGVNGTGMRGNYIICELITVDGSTPLNLFSVDIKQSKVSLGAR